MEDLIPVGPISATWISGNAAPVRTARLLVCKDYENRGTQRRQGHELRYGSILDHEVIVIE